MRKFIALTMVALLSLTVALAAIGCGKKEAPAESTPPAETSTMSSPDTGMSSMSSDTAAKMDTTMHK